MTGPVPASPPPADATGATSPPARPARPPTPRRHAGRVAIVVAVAAAMTLATPACGGSTSDATPTATLDRTPTTSTSPNPAPAEATATTEPLSPEQEVEQAYLDAADAFYRAIATANPQDSRLGATRTGEALERVRELVGDLDAKGLVVEYGEDGPPVPEIRKVEVTDEQTALVTFCIVDDGRQVEVDSGKVVDDRVQSRLNQATMKRADESWKVAAQKGIKLWEDGDGCDR